MTGNVWEWVSDQSRHGGSLWIKSAISSVVVQEWEYLGTTGYGVGFR